MSRNRQVTVNSSPFVLTPIPFPLPFGFGLVGKGLVIQKKRNKELLTPRPSSNLWKIIVCMRLYEIEIRECIREDMNYYSWRLLMLVEDKE